MIAAAVAFAGPYLAKFAATGFWRFASSGPGIVLFAGLGLGIFGVTAYAFGYAKASQKCDTKILRAELAKAQKELSVQRSAATFSKLAQDRLELEAETLNEKVADYESEILKRNAAKPNSACTVTKFDVGGMPDYGRRKARSSTAR